MAKKNKKNTGSQRRTLSASLEDYLEAIFNLAKRSQTARSKDIAKLLGVTRPSVTGALRLLKVKKLANYTPYGSVTLTDAGRKTAAEITRKHNILNSFFADVLGLRKDIAQKTACRAEHALGEKSVRRLLCFIEFVTAEGGDGSDMALKFRKYCRRAAQ